MRVFIKYPDKPKNEFIDGPSELVSLSFFKLDKQLKAKLTALVRMPDILTSRKNCLYVAVMDLNDVDTLSIYYCPARSSSGSGTCVGYIDLLTMPTRELKDAIEEEIRNFWKDETKLAEAELSLRA
jgi:hypothetical protein